MGVLSSNYDVRWTFIMNVLTISLKFDSVSKLTLNVT